MKKLIKFLHKIKRKNLIFASFIISLLTFSIASLASVLSASIKYYFFNDMYAFGEADFFEVEAFFWFYLILIAPVFESILMLVFYYVSQLLIPRFISCFLVAIGMSFIHGVTDVEQAIFVFPLFFISILLFVIMKRSTWIIRLLPVFLIHIFHNSYAVIGIYIDSMI